MRVQQCGSYPSMKGTKAAAAPASDNTARRASTLLEAFIVLGWFRLSGACVHCEKASFVFRIARMLKKRDRRVFCGGGLLMGLHDP